MPGKKSALVFNSGIAKEGLISVKIMREEVKTGERV